MKIYVLKRLIIAGVTLLGMSMLIFVLMRLAPGNITDIIFESAGYVDEADRHRLEAELGIVKPVAIQYLHWLGDFVRGDLGLVGELMTRLYGSADLFPDDVYHAFRPFQSVNYITSHDGFTLYDLVSYNEKHNLANGHDNQDGAHDYSWNCGIEGDAGASEEILRLRKQQVTEEFSARGVLQDHIARLLVEDLIGRHALQRIDQFEHLERAARIPREATA